MPTTGGDARYHPEVIWGPFLLAVALGLIVSAGLYFAYLWPAVEPDDDAPTNSEGSPAAGASAAPSAESGDALSTEPAPPVTS